MQKVKRGIRRKRHHKKVIVRAITSRSTRGWLEMDRRRWPCAFGRSGRKPLKREGDGATPVGHWRLRGVLYRADRRLAPRTGLPVRPIRPRDGWCDAVGDRNYNRPVQHPYPASAEQLWRTDSLYDVVVVLGCNDRPRIQGRGSAIFMHLARDGFEPTAGCIALTARDLSLVLAHCKPGCVVIVPA